MATDKIDLNNLDKSDWKTYRFDEIAINISERVDPNNTDLEVYVGLEHIDSESLHIKRFGTPDDVNGQKLKFYKGDIIFGRRRAYQRKAGIAPCDGFCSAHALVLRANPDVISPELFPFFLHSDLFMNMAVDISVGSLSPTINWRNLREQEFLIPSKYQQSIFSDLLIAINNATKKLSATKVEALKAKCAIWNKVRRSTKKIRVKDVADVFNGTTPSTGSSKYWDDGTIPWLPTGAVHERLIKKSEKFVTTLAVDEKKSKVFPRNSTLVAMIGQGRTRGTSAMLMIDAAINQNFACIVPKRIHPDFLFYCMSFSYDRLRAISQGTNQLALNCELVKNFQVPDLVVHEQVKYSNQLLSYDRVIDDIEAQIVESKSLQKSLINQVF